MLGVGQTAVDREGGDLDVISSLAVNTGLAVRPFADEPAVSWAIHRSGAGAAA